MQRSMCYMSNGSGLKDSADSEASKWQQCVTHCFMDKKAVDAKVEQSVFY